MAGAGGVAAVEAAAVVAALVAALARQLQLCSTWGSSMTTLMQYACRRYFGLRLGPLCYYVSLTKLPPIQHISYCTMVASKSPETRTVGYRLCRVDFRLLDYLLGKFVRRLGFSSCFNSV